MAFKFELHAALSLVGFQNNNRTFPVRERTFGDLYDSFNSANLDSFKKNELAYFESIKSNKIKQKYLFLI